jgi:radical SAM protein with 4Fe4S-binding SPASM domain
MATTAGVIPTECIASRPKGSKYCAKCFQKLEEEEDDDDENSSGGGHDDKKDDDTNQERQSLLKETNELQTTTTTTTASSANQPTAKKKDITPGRCSRCKVVYYCSRDCQRRHYKMIHSTGCRSLSDIRSAKHKIQLQKLHQQDDNHDDVGNTQKELVDLIRQEANTIFQMAYRYSDNVEHGRYMYDQAVDVYLEALKLDDNDNSENDRHCSTTMVMWVDHSRLLWVSLGYVDAFLESLFPLQCDNNKLPQQQLEEQNLWKKLKNDVNPPRQMTRAVQLGILLLKLKYIASLNGQEGSSKNNKVQIIQQYNEQVAMVKTYLNESGIEMIENHLQIEKEDNDDDENDQKKKKNDDDDVMLWMAFFNRSNAMGGMQFGPKALGWPSGSSSSSSSSPIEVVDRNSNNNGADDDRNNTVVSPPCPDFFMFLQDVCFWDAKVNSVIGQILDGDDDDDDDGSDNDDGDGDGNDHPQGYYSISGHLK